LTRLVEHVAKLPAGLYLFALYLILNIVVQLYLTPKVQRAGDNIKRYANPTPLGFVGFVISTMTFSMILMGWGGANGSYAVS
jgi:hypothetical protein